MFIIFLLYAYVQLLGTIQFDVYNKFMLVHFSGRPSPRFQVVRTRAVYIWCRYRPLANLFVFFCASS